METEIALMSTEEARKVFIDPVTNVSMSESNSG